MRQWFVFLGLFLTACGPTTSESLATAVPPSAPNAAQPTPSPSPGAASTTIPTPTEAEVEITATAVFIEIDLDAIPPVDTSQHSVSLEEIYFDTFQPINRAVPLSDADENLIRSLRDAIPPIYNPVFESAAGANNWLREDDIVLGYAAGDEVFAYPVRILNFHEIVSHDVNGRPVMATYCNDQTLTFAWQDGVIEDEQTGSTWTFAGEAITGELVGIRLEALPVRSTLWFAMIAAYPDLILYSP